MKAYVVGGGLFGQIAAAHLRKLGYETTVFDSRKKNSGSRAAGCVMKPSWMQSLDYKKPMALLDSLYGVSTIKFTLPVLSTDCFWVDPKKVMDWESTVNETVLEVGDGFVRTESKTVKGLVVVAAGYWTKALLPDLPEIRGMCGSAALAHGKVTAHIRPTAPYRQAVWFNIAKDQVWFGDGTAILLKNFDQSHVDRTRDRAKELAGIEAESMVSGIRPYVVGNSGGFFQKISDKLFVSTGGAKNGTILAANQALLLEKGLKLSNS